MSESKWTRRICQEMEECNALVFAIVASRRQEPGWPDRYVAHTWWQGWLEFKGLTTIVATKQVIIMRKLRVRGVDVYIVRYPNRIEDIDGELWRLFDGSGLGLLKELAR